MDDWRSQARAETAGIKAFWATKYGWKPVVEERDDCIDLYITFAKLPPPGDGSEQPPVVKFVLRLRYQSDYETAGRREAFVNPENLADDGQNFWPTGISGINPIGDPPNVCLEGTYGFHSHLHRDRDGRRAQLNKLLMEVEQCLNP